MSKDRNIEISKYDLDKAKKNILTIEEQISSTNRNLNNLV